MFDDAAFDEEALTLTPGDVIVAFSDGVSEAVNESGEEYTDDRLLAAATLNRSRPPRELLDALLADLRAFCGRDAERRRHDGCRSIHGVR